MSLYRTKDGDRIDLIVLKHYGDLKHLNDVIGANNHLCKIPMDLKSGIDIELPEFVVKNNIQAEFKERGPLW